MRRNIEKSVGKPKTNYLVIVSFFPFLIGLTEELDSVTNELHAVDIQIQELLERQQELIQKKNILTNRIKQHLEASDAGESSEWDSSPGAWNKEGLLCFSLLVLFLLVSLHRSLIIVPGSVLSSGLEGKLAALQVAWETSRQTILTHVLFK